MFWSVSTRPWQSCVLGIAVEESTFRKRRFPAGRADKQSRLERIGGTFIAGYNAALVNEVEELPAELATVESEFRGFAFEGASMALALLDSVAPGRGNRFATFLKGPGDLHAYMIHVGAGWAYARLPWLRYRIGHVIRRLDPLLRWLAVDGYGFHEGYFHWPQAGEGQKIPFGLQGYACQAFDQGLGRVLWFVRCADPDRVSDTIARFPVSRRPDLWSGAGLACAYAGGAEGADLERAVGLSGAYRDALAQGAAFAAKARLRAGNPVLHTERACRAICGLSAADAAALTDDALKRLPEDGEVPAFEIWRQRIQREFAGVRR